MKYFKTILVAALVAVGTTAIPQSTPRPKPVPQTEPVGDPGSGGSSTPCDCAKGCANRTPIRLLKCTVDLDTKFISCTWEDMAYTYMPCA